MDVRAANAMRDVDAAVDVHAVQRRRWGVADAVDGARDDGADVIDPRLAAVEDPGEVERGFSSLWSSSSWFGSGGAFEAAPADTASVSYDQGVDGAKSAGEKSRAIGGASCQNRFIVNRGARDPFAPASASATPDEADKARVDAMRRDDAADSWKVTRWNTSLVPGAFDETRVRKAGERSYRSFERGTARRMTEERGVKFEFDFDAKRWWIIRDGESKELSYTPMAVAPPRSVDVSALSDEIADMDASDASTDGEVDEEGREMREKAREERLRRYQPSYDASSARVVVRERERRDRYAEEPDYKHDVHRSTTSTTSTSTAAAATITRSNTASEAFDPGLPAVDAYWVPFTCSNGLTAWIELANDDDASSALTRWVNGDAPWPVIRRLDLGRDRRGIPQNAPGPEIDAELRALVESELRARAAEAETVRATPASTGPRARAVNDDSSNAPHDAQTDVVNAILRAATAPSTPASTDAVADAVSSNEKILQSKLKECIREKHAALAEVERLRAFIVAAGLNVDERL